MNIQSNVIKIYNTGDSSVLNYEKKMKSKYGWKSSGNGTNSSRLNCSPGAGRSSTGIVFGTIGGNVGYWSSSDVNKTTSARSINLDFYSSKVYTYRINKKNGFYVRCVKK